MEDFPICDEGKWQCEDGKFASEVLLKPSSIANAVFVVAGRCVEWNYAKELCSANEVIYNNLPLCNEGEWQCGDGKFTPRPEWRWSQTLKSLIV